MKKCPPRWLDPAVQAPQVNIQPTKLDSATIYIYIYIYIYILQPSIFSQFCVAKCCQKIFYNCNV